MEYLKFYNAILNAIESGQNGKRLPYEVEMQIRDLVKKTYMQGAKNESAAEVSPEKQKRIDMLLSVYAKTNMKV